MSGNPLTYAVPHPMMQAIDARVVRAASALLAVAVALWGLTASVFRDRDGYLTAQSVFPLAFAAAALIIATTYATRWGRAGGWLALQVAAAGAALQLIDAPNRVVYQHYRLGADVDWRTLVVPLGVLAIQAAVVVWSLVRRPGVGALVSWWRNALPRWGRWLLLTVYVSTGAIVSRAIGLYVAELVVAAFLQLFALLNAVAFARAVPEGSVRGTLLDATTAGVPRARDPLSVSLALWVLVVSSFLAVRVYGNHPHVPDEVVYLLQAKYLAHGMLSMPLPPVLEAFNLDLMYYDAARWFSPVPPGWPFALAVGAFYGVPWLVNPLLGAANVILANGVLAELVPPRTRRLTIVLFAASPWFLFMSMNFMTHQLTLAAALAAALAVARARRVQRGRIWRMLLGGVCIGVVSLVRPLEGLAVAALLGLWSLGIKGMRFRLAPSVALVVGTVASASLVRPYNQMLTGDPSYFPIMAYIDKYYAPGANDMGFGANRGLGWSGLDPFPGHGPADVIVNAALNFASINTELLGWAFGALVLAVFPFASRRARRVDWYMAAVIAVIVGVHSFYWFSGGPDFGARYWYLVILPCTLLVARGLEELGALLARHLPDAPRRVQLTALALVLAALVTFVPWRAVSKYHNYRNMRPDIRTLAAEHDFGRSLVLIRGKRHPDYASAGIYNPVDLHADEPIYAWDVSPEVRQEVLAVYGDRPIWIVDGTTRTGGRMRVVAGPLTPMEALTHP